MPIHKIFRLHSTRLGQISQLVRILQERLAKNKHVIANENNSSSYCLGSSVWCIIVMSVMSLITGLLCMKFISIMCGGSIIVATTPLHVALCIICHGVCKSDSEDEDSPSQVVTFLIYPVLIYRDIKVRFLLPG